MTSLISLLTAYYLCDAIAAERVMPLAEWTACSQTYRAIKLSFIEGVTVEDMARLSAAERAAVEIAGYRAFKSWEAENADLVAALRAS